MTRDQWEMNAVRSLQKVQDKLAKDMVRMQVSAFAVR